MSFKLIRFLAILAGSAATFSPVASYALPAALQQSNSGPGVYIDLSHLDAFQKGGEELVIIDIRTPDRYAAGHIPGAINIPRELIEWGNVDGVLGETKPIEELEPILAEKGLKYDQRIVVYGEKTEGDLTYSDGRYAGKIYVSLEFAGFEKVHVLDGGVESWTGALSTEETVLPASDLKLTNSKPVIVDKAYVLAALGREDENIFVLDMGGQSRNEATRIAGSHSAPTGLYSDTNKLHDDLTALVARLEELGVRKDSEIITSCGWGWAASDGLALLKDLGYTNVKLYDGSWTEWGLDPNTPKAGTQFENI